MTQRTIDSPTESGHEPGDGFRVAETVSPNDLLKNGDPREMDTEAEMYKWLELRATYMDGAFIKPRAGVDFGDTYHAPHGYDIVKSERYVLLFFERHGLTLPIYEGRFEQLVDESVLHKIN